VRLTDGALAWLGDHASDLINQLVPGGLSFTLQESSQLGGLVVICPSSSHPQGCPLRVDLAQAVLIRSAPSGLVATLLLDIPRQNIPVRAFGTDCNVIVSAQRTPVQILFTFEIDPLTRALNATAAVRPISGDNLDIGGTGLCATVTLFRGFLLGRMQEELQKTLTESLEDRLCLPCAAGCPPPSACAARDLCRHASGRCVARRQGVEGQMDLAASLGTLATQPRVLVRYGLYPGGNVGVDGDGVTLGVIGGGGAEPASCVPSLPARARDPVIPPPFPATAPDGAPYHIAVALSREGVEDLLGALWRAGAFCLLPGSRNVPQLSSDVFGLVLPVVTQLTGGKSRPVLLAVRLDSEPRVKVGRGTSHLDAQGQRVLDEPLLEITLPDLLLDLYLLVEDRMVRIGRVQQDVILPLGIDLTADGKLALLVGDTSRSVRNARVSEAEILGGTAANLEHAVPTLVSLALPFALQSLRPFEIPTFSGFGIAPRGSRGEGPATGLTHAAIYADLRLAPGGSPLRTTASTSVRVLSARPGAVDLALSGISPTGDPLEWSWRMGPGLWSLWTPARRLRINDPRLMLLGEHRIEVRARAAGRPETADSTPAVAVFRIEPIAEPPAAPQARGCQAAPGAGLGAWALLALLAIGRGRRRRTEDPPRRWPLSSRPCGRASWRSRSSRRS
jgi:hypothetical protein